MMVRSCLKLTSYLILIGALIIERSFTFLILMSGKKAPIDWIVYFVLLVLVAFEYLVSYYGLKSIKQSGFLGRTILLGSLSFFLSVYLTHNIWKDLSFALQTYSWQALFLTLLALLC